MIDLLGYLCTKECAWRYKYDALTGGIATPKPHLGDIPLIGPHKHILYIYIYISETKKKPKEEIFGRTSLRTCGQKLRSGPPTPGQKNIRHGQNERLGNYSENRFASVFFVYYENRAMRKACDYDARPGLACDASALDAKSLAVWIE